MFGGGRFAGGAPRGAPRWSRCLLSDDVRPRPPRALIAIALLSGAAILGLLLGASGWGAGAAKDQSPPGLRAGQLPAGLDGHPAPAFRLRDGRGGTIDTR